MSVIILLRNGFLHLWDRMVEVDPFRDRVKVRDRVSRKHRPHPSLSTNPNPNEVEQLGGQIQYGVHVHAIRRRGIGTGA